MVLPPLWNLICFMHHNCNHNYNYNDNYNNYNGNYYNYCYNNNNYYYNNCINYNYINNWRRVARLPRPRSRGCLQQLRVCERPALQC